MLLIYSNFEIDKSRIGKRGIFIEKLDKLAKVQAPSSNSSSIPLCDPLMINIVSE